VTTRGRCGSLIEVKNPYKMDHEPIAPPQVAASKYRCATCAYDLTGTTIGGVCPECGTSIEQSLRPIVSGGRTSQLALWSMILGIASIAICAVFGPIAIILAVLARKDLEDPTCSVSSRGFAMAGLVLGIISTVLTAVVVALLAFVGLSTP